MRRLYCVCAILWAVSYPLPGVAAEILTVSKALEIARENNPQLQIALKEIGMAEARLDQAKAYPNPSLAFFAGVQEGETDPTRGSVVGGEIAQEIELFGRRRLRRGVAEQGIAVTEQRRQVSWQDQVLAVKGSFYEILATEQILQTAKDNLAIVEKFLGATELKFQQNEVPYSDVLRARLELVRMRSQMMGFESKLEERRHEFNILLGRSPEMEFQVTGELQDRVLKYSREELIERALRTRPEMAVNRAESTRASLQQDLARRWLPDPEFMFFGEKEGEEIRLGGGIGFALPLWYRNKGEIREAEQLEGQTEIRRDALQHEIEREVRDAYLQLQAMGRVLSVKREGIRSSAELMRTTFQSYQEGTTPFLKFLETLRTVNDFKTDYYATLALWQRQKAVLERAVGSEL